MGTEETELHTIKSDGQDYALNFPNKGWFHSMEDESAGGEVLSHIQTVTLAGQVTRDQALLALAEAAIATGWAREGYGEALIAREAAYPTGLHTRGVQIAIPHADPEWTLVPGMVVGMLDEPVEFQPMGGQGEDVLARIILLLVIPDADAHINFLRALSAFIEDEARLAEFSATRNLETLVTYLREELFPRTV